MTVTRQSLRFKCSVPDCPWPKDEEIHVPWCLGIPDVEHWADKPTHQHFPKKGMGGNNPKSKIVAILCPPCHDRIDNGDWGNDIKDIPGRGRVYFAWDLHGETLIEKGIDDPALSATAESGRGVTKLSEPNKYEKALGPITGPTEGSAAAPSAGLSTKEESDGRPEATVADTGIGDTGGDVGSSDGGDTLRIGPLTHEQRVAISKEIKDAEWGRQWLAGDTANAWRAEMGEEAEQYISDFGYVQESIANIMYVCEKIPKRLRGYNLRFSHFVVVAGENLEDMEMWLDKCEEEQWPVAEFRRQVKGTKPRVKRYSVEELRAALKDWYVADAGTPAGIRVGMLVRFLDWLEEQA